MPVVLSVVPTVDAAGPLRAVVVTDAVAVALIEGFACVVELLLVSALK